MNGNENNPFESPRSPEAATPKTRIKNIWAVNRADMAIVFGVFLLLVLAYLVS